MSAPVVWRRRRLSNYGQFRAAMLKMNPKEADAFYPAFREHFGSKADAVLFTIAAMSKTLEQTMDMLAKFTKGDYTGEFHVAPAPQDKWGNTGWGTCVMRVRFVLDGGGYTSLKILAPDEVAFRWPHLSPFGHFQIVEGPARLLSREEWGQLVGFEPPPD